ncbi:hypothetical protein Arth_1176 [Arthrobacter sp. FB24]|uniref:hypothetical protein n=1 Tax=Arthrobacter sp. (strain FB24) TaxID=290399 RepID=UPI0000526EE3|nr:hypothetical protein [Arthrobacter sp. FB24]ABK02570.1 hypothetical protein Arth_1176 [Arthrobacter sp. FB24]
MSTWDARRQGEAGQRNKPADMAMTFRNLCRSSPWKWQSLRFEYVDRAAADSPNLDPTGTDAENPDPDNTVQAWLRRPGALRLESAAGVVLHSTTGINDSRDGFYVSSTRKTWLLPPQLVTPVYDDGGLVRRRPEAAYGEPCFGNGRFAAALDPVELAGNAPVPIEFPNTNAVELGPITAVDHQGRPALEAVVTPNAAYRPTDPLAPLCGPGRNLIRIDVGTGVCVSSRSLENESRGSGHWLRILAVDEYMLDDLFLAESMNLTDVRRHITWDISRGA